MKSFTQQCTYFCGWHLVYKNAALTSNSSLMSMKNIVKRENAVSRQFLGVDFVVLSVGNNSMVTKMLYKTTDHVPFHQHPNEQSGYVISGKYILKFNGQEHEL